VQENKLLFSCSGAIITAVAESIVVCTVCVMWVLLLAYYIVTGEFENLLFTRGKLIAMTLN